MARLSARKKAILESMMRESLFSAAEKLVQEEGWKGATVERIAQEAGVSKGTVYNYFQDKREILCSLLERNTEEVRLFVGSLDPEKGNPVDVLEDVLTKILRNLYEKRKLIAATMQAYYEDVDLRGNLEPPSNMQEKHPLWEIRVFIRKIIARGVEKKFFRPVDPVMAETALNALIMGVAKQFAMDMLGFSGEVYMVTVRKLAVQGLCERNTSSQ